MFSRDPKGIALFSSSQITRSSPLDRARRKAYLRLLPILFACYVIAYVDRVNVSLAKLTMSKDLPAFNNDVIGTGAGIFFLGYFLLEIPGTLLVERWSARKWICRIMVSWGVVAALTAFAKTPHEFYAVRFLLGLAEAGFFPGAIVYMTHWFPSRDRTRALSWYLAGSSVAQIISPKISNWLLGLGTFAHPGPLGLAGWQWLYVAWGIPAVLLGLYVLLNMPDYPHQAAWLSDEEKLALTAVLGAENKSVDTGGRSSWLAAMRQPRVLLLTLAYFCIMGGNYGFDTFMPSILEQWYALKISSTTWLITLPPILGVAVILLIGWNSDRTRERRLHAAVPGILGGIALAIMPQTQGHLLLTMLCFLAVASCIKSYMPAFWAIPSLFLTDVAAAASIGLINSVGNLGGFLGPMVVGKIETATGSFVAGIYCLSAALIAFGVIVILVAPRSRSPRPDKTIAASAAL
jgi:MFS transporter, ACS family, tartrate transporter